MTNHQQQGRHGADVFTYSTRVYYEHTDAGGVMYHANYISVIEHARMEFWLKHGYNPARGQSCDRIAFVAVDSSMQWLKAAMLSDIIEITVKAVSAKRVSMVYEHEIYRREEDGTRTLLNTASLTLVCIDLNTLRATTIPADMKQRFLNG